MVTFTKVTFIHNKTIFAKCVLQKRQSRPQSFRNRCSNRKILNFIMSNITDNLGVLIKKKKTFQHTRKHVFGQNSEENVKICNTLDTSHAVRDLRTKMANCSNLKNCHKTTTLYRMNYVGTYCICFFFYNEKMRIFYFQIRRVICLL